MSDQKFEVSAGSLSDTRGRAAPSVKDHQIAELVLPAEEVLQKIGRAAVRFGQLEHLLKVIYKRASPNVTLQAVLKLKFSLGSLLAGAREYGEILQFKGLLKAAEENPRLASIRGQLEQAQNLVETRNQYLHNGIGKSSNGKFFFLNSGRELDITELDKASTLTEALLLEINNKIPPIPK